MTRIRPDILDDPCFKEEPGALLAATVGMNRGWLDAYERGRKITPPESTDIVAQLWISPGSTVEDAVLEAGEDMNGADPLLPRWLCRYREGEPVPTHSHCGFGLQNRPGVLVTPLRFKIGELTGADVMLPDTGCLVFKQASDHVIIENIVFRGAHSLV